MNKIGTMLLGLVLALALLAGPAAAQDVPGNGGGTDTVPACGDRCPSSVDGPSIQVDVGDDWPPCRPSC